MHWFLNTYLPGILYYVVIPTLVGIAYACAMQFEYRRRLLKDRFVDEEDENEQSAESVMQSVASLAGLAADAEESEQLELPAAVEESFPVDSPVAEAIPSAAKSSNVLDKVFDSLITGVHEQPESAPGFLGEGDAGAEEAKSLEFFTQQENDNAADFDDAVAMDEFAKASFAAELAPIDVDENFSENAASDDPFGQDLAAAILGSSFNFNDLNKKAGTEESLESSPEKSASEKTASGKSTPAKPSKPPKVSDAFTQQMAAIPMLEAYRRDISHEAILSCSLEHLATSDAMQHVENLPHEIFAPIETAPLIKIPQRRKIS